MLLLLRMRSDVSRTVRLPFSVTMTPATDSAAVTSVVVNSTTVGFTCGVRIKYQLKQKGQRHAVI